MIEQIESTITSLKKRKPLVLCVTNYVTMDFMANSLLAVGAAPLMSECDEELEELIKMAHAVTINIGTISEPFRARSLMAAKLSKKYRKPIILDPVGAGASLIRTNLARDLMVYADIIRGNASEIMAIMDDEQKTLGVESLSHTAQAKEVACTLANKSDLTVVVSGAEDFIANSTRQQSLTYGSPLMSLVTGMGCSLSAIIAAFKSILQDPFEAGMLGTAYFGLCGSLASIKTNKPGTFHNVFLDELYTANYKEMRQYAK